MNAFLATLLLIFVVGSSVSAGILVSYWTVRAILYTFAARVTQDRAEAVVVVERTRAAAAGD